MNATYNEWRVSRQWNCAIELVGYYGYESVVNLSRESFSLSTRQAQLTVDQLMESIFSGGEPLTILMHRSGLNQEIYSTIIIKFLSTAADITMREFSVTAHAPNEIVWPELTCGLTSLEPNLDTGTWRFDGSRVAHEQFHYKNILTGQWLNVELTVVGDRDNIRKVSFHLARAPSCIREPQVISPQRPLLATILYDSFLLLARSELDVCQLATKRWNTLIDTRYRSLPLRFSEIVRYEGNMMSMHARRPSRNHMQQALRACFDRRGGKLVDPSSLLRNAYVKQIVTSIQSTHAALLDAIERARESSDVVFTEFRVNEPRFPNDVLDAALFMGLPRRLDAIELHKTPLDMLINDYDEIFDKDGVMGRTKHLYLDVPSLGFVSPPQHTSVFDDIRAKWMDFLFGSECSEATFVTRTFYGPYPEGFYRAFDVNEVIERFLSADKIDRFTTCIVHSTNIKQLHPLPVAGTMHYLSALNLPCAKHISERIPDFAHRYRVYSLRNDRANADLTVLEGKWKRWQSRVILLKGKIEPGVCLPDD